MDRHVLLQDIDDWELYARAVLSYVRRWHQDKLATIDSTINALATNQSLHQRTQLWGELDELVRELRAEMARVIIDSITREKRLTDRTYRLTDAVLDEERTEGDPSPHG